MPSKPADRAGTRLPPLAWLRAFAEAGRYESFKQAAEAMHVTPSTVSHEIRNLEEWLSLPLFHRKGRGLELTDEGRRLHDAVSRALEGVADAIEEIVERDADPRIGMFPFLASEIVVSNQAKLDAHLGNHRIKIDANIHISALTAPERSRRCDAIVRYAERPVPGFEAIELTRVRIGPAVAPDYLAKRGHATLRDLSADRVVRVDGPFGGWPTWCEAAGREWENARDVISVDNYVAALRMVEQGVGIGLILLPIAQTWLDARRLVLLDAPMIELAERYWLVYPRHSPHHECLQLFADWLRNELAGR